MLNSVKDSNDKMLSLVVVNQKKNPPKTKTCPLPPIWHHSTTDHCTYHWSYLSARTQFLDPYLFVHSLIEL